MEKVLLLYKNKHASHRIVSSTMDTYKYRSGYKSRVNLKSYCVGKRGALRLDRYLLKENFDVVYIHEEHVETIKLLEELGINYVTYTRSDFCIRYTYSGYKTSVTYTLLNEIIHKTKQKHGKIKVYYVANYQVCETMKFESDVSGIQDRYFKNYKDAEDRLIIVLEEKIKFENIQLEKLNYLVDRKKDKIKDYEGRIKNMREE